MKDENGQRRGMPIAMGFIIAVIILVGFFALRDDGGSEEIVVPRQLLPTEESTFDLAEQWYSIATQAREELDVVRRDLEAAETRSAELERELADLKAECEAPLAAEKERG